MKTRHVRSALVPLIVLGWLVSGAGLAAQSEPPDIAWVDGPDIGQMGKVAQVNVPEGFRFTDAKGARTLMELMQNPTSGQEVGALLPEEGDWFVLFEFDSIGYVKDDEKDSIDADELLASIRRGTEAANKERAERGWATVHVVGWQQPPRYDAVTHNLVWAIRGQSEQDFIVNQSTRLLGRHGVMSVDLIVDPADLEQVLPQFNRLIDGFTFTAGNRYAEFRAGDKIASYGLTALIAGGVGAAAVKSGLLAKFWKVIVFGFLALLGAIRSFLRRLFGRGRQEATAVR